MTEKQADGHGSKGEVAGNHRRQADDATERYRRLSSPEASLSMDDTCDEVALVGA